MEHSIIKVEHFELHILCMFIVVPGAQPSQAGRLSAAHTKQNIDVTACVHN